MNFIVQLTTMPCAVWLLLLFASDLVKGSNYSPEQVFYDQHSRTSSPFGAAASSMINEKLARSAFSRFIIGQHTLPPNIIKITERVAVKVPYAQLIPVPHNVPYPYAVPVARPFPIVVPQVVNLNQNTPIESSENAQNPLYGYGEPEQIFNDAQTPSQATFGNYGNYGSEISQELLPPP